MCIFHGMVWWYPLSLTAGLFHIWNISNCFTVHFHKSIPETWSVCTSFLCRNRYSWKLLFTDERNACLILSLRTWVFTPLLPALVIFLTTLSASWPCSPAQDSSKINSCKHTPAVTFFFEGGDSTHFSGFHNQMCTQSIFKHRTFKNGMLSCNLDLSCIFY